MKIFGSIQELVELVYRKGSNTVTLKPNASQAANVTVSLPVLTTDDTIVTEAKAQALSNKTSIGVGSLTLSSANISSAGDLGLTAVSGTVKIYSPVYLFGGNSLTLWDFDNSNSIAISVPGTVTANRTPQIPDASGDFVLTTATQTLTNKTISGSSNTLTNLPAASITGILPAANGGTGVNSSATFPSTGTVAVLTDISASQLSGIVPGSKGGTGINNGGTLTYGTNNITLSTSGVTSLTLPTSGTLATLAGSETLLNKLISSTGAITGALTLPSGTQAERPSPVAGMIRYNTSSSSFEGYANGVWSGIGGGGTTDLITQVAHGFVVGDVLYLNGSTYAKANATAAATAEVVGVVSRVIGVDQFELTLSGEISGLTSANFTEAALPAVGEAIFLSTTAGKMTITEPTTIGQVSVPVGVRSVGADTMYVAPKRGAVVGGTNARAQVSLTSGATTNVQNLAGYDAGEITGWVFISSAAPVRFYLSAKFAKSGSGGDYNLSYSTTGDTPPTGFLVDITTTGIIRVTLPASSGSTSVINYALNAPAIGASFPLTVNASQVQGRTDGSAIASGYVGQKITWTTPPPSQQLVTTTETDWANSLITLTPGVWQIFASIQCVAQVAPAVGAEQAIYLKITDSGNVVINNLDKSIYIKNVAAAPGAMQCVISMNDVVNISSSTTYKIRTLKYESGGSAQSYIYNASPSSFSHFYAVRIA